jgi:hypothetical protein
VQDQKVGLAKEVELLEEDGTVKKYIMPFKLKNEEIKKVVGKSPMKGKLKPCQKAAAKRKFKVYPSAYANMWASRHKC